MPLVPDVVAEFAVGPVCPPPDALTRLSDQLADAFLPSLGGSRKAFAVCARRSALGTNVVSMGIWGDASGFSDAELRMALVAENLLVPGRTAALLVTAGAIQRLATAAWATTDKTVGRVTLGETIDVNLRPNRIVTAVRGTFDPPLLVLPNIDFSVEVTDTLSLRPPGSDPPLETDTSTDVDASVPGMIAVSLLVGLLSPILGAIVFFGSDAIADAQAPASPGAGGALAGQWPAEVLTQIVPPFLSGKFAFSWRDLTVDERGVRTLGTFASVARRPRVSIAGPRSLAMRGALGHAQATYAARPRDLRAPLTVQWSGAAHSTEMGERVLFHSAGRSRIGVDVRDVDGLTAADQITVDVKLVELEPGQQPF